MSPKLRFLLFPILLLTILLSSTSGYAKMDKETFQFEISQLKIDAITSDTLNETSFFDEDFNLERSQMTCVLSESSIEDVTAYVALIKLSPILFLRLYKSHTQAMLSHEPRLISDDSLSGNMTPVRNVPHSILFHKLQIHQN